MLYLPISGLSSWLPRFCYSLYRISRDRNGHDNSSISDINYFCFDRNCFVVRRLNSEEVSNLKYEQRYLMYLGYQR